MKAYSFLAMLYVCFAITACAEGATSSGGHTTTQTTEPQACLTGDSTDCDGDGFSPGDNASDDCNDYNADANPDHQEICDGIDNDCDGNVDNVPNRWSACNASLCGGNGHMDCVADHFVCVSTPQVETCNGIDDDCDGIIDNGCCYPDGPEICDGVDNDCDGSVDNVQEDDGMGVTKKIGDSCVNNENVGICVNGTWQCADTPELTCVTASPSAEKCDGLDNDCNGYYDDTIVDSTGHTTGTTCTVANAFGPCAQGTWTCNVANPMEPFSCVTSVSPTGEICDGIDNDCDGIIDNVGASVGLTSGCPATGGCGNGSKVWACNVNTVSLECQAVKACWVNFVFEGVVGCGEACP